MTEEAKRHYFVTRVLKERTMSRRAVDKRAADAHAEMADRYEALAIVFGAKRSAGSLVDYF